MDKCQRIFIGSTRQNDGKTVISIGLVLALKKRFGRVGFIKPVGQKYVVVDGEKIDKDAVLMKHVCGLEDDLKDINPVAVEEGFTRRYLETPDAEGLARRIRRSYEAVARGKDVVVVEGTGHAGVGSVFGMNNARVASILDLPAVLISLGGIGRPIDELTLNRALFAQEAVPIRGVILNKVLPEKRSVIEKSVALGLRNMGMEPLGFLPYVPSLAQPTMLQICEAVGGRIVSGEGRMTSKIGTIVVGAMTPSHSLDYFKQDSLLITPGDREDLILTALTLQSGGRVVSGLVLTGGLTPHRKVLDLVQRADIPAVLAQEGTYEIASYIHELVVKVREEDTDKIATAAELVAAHVDIDRLLACETGGPRE